jgi:hypothetical protein
MAHEDVGLPDFAEGPKLLDVPALHPCFGRFVQNGLNVHPRALLTKMPLLGMGLARNDSQLFILCLVFSAQIANVDSWHERSPFSWMHAETCARVRSSGTVMAGGKRPASFVRRGALAKQGEHIKA